MLGKLLIIAALVPLLWGCASPSPIVEDGGTREYNLALGERRSQAVQRLLMFQGASKEQAETVSFGEEVPVAFGHDEESWGLNRRVELVYER